MEQLNKKLKELKSILSDAMIKQIDLDLKIKLVCKINEAINVNQSYLNINKKKPKNESVCIVNNGADNYHIAFWDEENNGFVNNTGYLQKEFDKWIYSPINVG